MPEAGAAEFGRKFLRKDLRPRPCDRTGSSTSCFPRSVWLLPDQLHRQHPSECKASYPSLSRRSSQALAERLRIIFGMRTAQLSILDFIRSPLTRCVGPNTENAAMRCPYSSAWSHWVETTSIVVSTKEGSPSLCRIGDNSINGILICSRKRRRGVGPLGLRWLLVAQSGKIVSIHGQPTHLPTGIGGHIQTPVFLKQAAPEQARSVPQ